VDPGILTYLMRQGGGTGENLDELLNTKSGLLGISGVSGDMRKIVERMNKGDARAKLAIEIFVHRLRKGIGAMIAVLGGVDALVFSAGIGENSAEVRAAACGGFEFLGMRIDLRKNQSSREDRDIADADSAVRVMVVRAQEDWAIAKSCWGLMDGKLGDSSGAS
jgi:acetate kinase